MQNVVEPLAAHWPFKQSPELVHAAPSPPDVATHAALSPFAMHWNIAGQPLPPAASHVCEHAPFTQMRDAQSVPIAHASPSCPVT